MGLEFTKGEFSQVLKRTQSFYRTIGHVYCPYFHNSVMFKADGLEHLRRRSWNRGRPRPDQFMRLKHISAAPAILQKSSTVQGIWHGQERLRRHRHGRWEELFVPTTFYEFIAVFEDRRFKVIIKEQLAGERVFWSLIPFWRQTPAGKRLLYNGDPAHD